MASKEWKDTEMNWIEIYNRLFELINVQGDAATYFSGSRFINTVKEFVPYFPDYGQYIDLRNKEGKSTSRKIFYYDILLALNEEIRLKVLNRFLEILKPFQSQKVEKIEELLGQKPINTGNEKPEVVNVSSLSNPIVFISYSWDDDEHMEWVLNLANRFTNQSIACHA